MICGALMTQPEGGMPTLAEDSSILYRQNSGTLLIRLDGLQSRDECIVLVVESVEWDIKHYGCLTDKHIEQASVMAETIICKNVQGFATVFGSRPN